MSNRCVLSQDRKTGTEGSGSDKIWQTVPDTCSGEQRVKMFPSDKTRIVEPVEECRQFVETILNYDGDTVNIALYRAGHAMCDKICHQYHENVVLVALLITEVLS